MKTLHAIVVATIAAGACGNALAANAQRQLEAVTVQSPHVDCTPPSSSALCSALHARIRLHFSPREIGMLFGARTSYPEASTTYERVNLRYAELVREIAATFGGADAIAAR
ncbi:hypothetical protein [Dokdonella fugitiva]|jgi:hypothetical protein|uniref:Uncharacterized protein n=1 Tax=Dokdonella fugitiva TaxID=328517 RepID=A0A4R2I862_9GAMM|nr:hypothetical protein [Dokdonella fugitiva]MBA8884059.1 hypothetical protein [Dokdonella fugitiva]TCO38755.1 hypothetical protein EV148_10743 [Dokdonella fugitiva]